MIKRFGSGDDAYYDAENYAEHYFDDEGQIHLVEVFDEGTHWSERHGAEVGVIYAVPQSELDSFLEKHDGAEVQDSIGYAADEEE